MAIYNDSNELFAPLLTEKERTDALERALIYVTKQKFIEPACAICAYYQQEDGCDMKKCDNYNLWVFDYMRFLQKDSQGESWT